MVDVVIGSNGFIGRKLVSRLESNCVLVDSQVAFEIFLKSTDYLNFENVYWVAGSAKSDTQFESPLLQHPDYKSLQIFLTSNSVSFKRFFYCSSGGAVYGPGFGPFSEQSSTCPVNMYGQLKLNCEELILQWIPDKAFIFRISNVFGVHDNLVNASGIIASWVRQISSDKPIKIYGSLSNYRDYVLVDDLVEAILIGKTSQNAGIFNIGSGEKITISQILEIFTEIRGEKLIIQKLPNRSTDRLGYVLDISKAKRVLGWKPSEPAAVSISNAVKTSILKTIG